MKLPRTTIALYVGLVFLCGGVVGFFANRLYNASTVTASVNTKKDPADIRKAVVSRYQTRLKLNDDQVQKLNIILDESKAQLDAIHSQETPQVDAVWQNQITRMKLMLNPDQQAEYDTMLREIRERQKQKGRTNRPGGRGF
jgi:protein subunit release factor A